MHCRPNCGADLLVLAPVEYGNVATSEDGSIVFDGCHVPLSRTLHAIAECIIRARGRGVNCGVLAAHLPGEVFDDSIKKIVERLRGCLRVIAPHFDQIETLRGFGAYRWQYPTIPQASGLVVRALSE